MAIVITLTDAGANWTVSVAGCDGGDLNYVVAAAAMPQEIKDLVTDTTNTVLVLGAARPYPYMDQLGNLCPSGALGVAFRDGLVLHKNIVSQWLPIA